MILSKYVAWLHVPQSERSQNMYILKRIFPYSGKYWKAKSAKSTFSQSINGREQIPAVFKASLYTI